MLNTQYCYCVHLGYLHSRPESGDASSDSGIIVTYYADYITLHIGSGKYQISKLIQ